MPIAKLNSGRKLFFGLFVFPLLIAIGMAVLLCSVVLLTHEQETPESLITAIKTGSPSKRWQKAFELSNELNRKDAKGIRNLATMREVIHILQDPSHYDAKTRSYMAIALAHFDEPEAAQALKKSLQNKDEEEEVKLQVFWSLGVLKNTAALPEIIPFLKSAEADLRKMAVYVLGAIGDPAAIPSLRPLLNDAVEDIRWNAALSLARLGNDSGLEVLLKMLDRQSLVLNDRLAEPEIETIMINATKGLALIKRSESLETLKKISREDKNLKVRQAAMEALHYQKEALRL